jgi:hypothetical protein
MGFGVSIDHEGSANCLGTALALGDEAVAEQRFHVSDDFAAGVAVELAQAVPIKRRSVSDIEANELMKGFLIEAVIGACVGGFTTQSCNFHD